MYLESHLSSGIALSNSELSDIITTMQNFKKEKILFRADASDEIGMGHVIRMLALGQYLSDNNYEIHFATRSTNESVLDLLKDEGFIVHLLNSEFAWNFKHDFECFAEIAKSVRSNWIVIDGSHFEEIYELQIRALGFKLMRIVDFSDQHYCADLIINQNIGAEHLSYSVEPYTKIFAGPAYRILRREFANFDSSNTKLKANTKPNILVSLGGSTGPTSLLNEILSQAVMQLSDSFALKMIQGFSKVNMFKEMSHADLAIVSAGSTMWELAQLRIPFFAIAITKEQNIYLNSIEKYDFFVNLGWYEDLTVESIQRALLGFFHNDDQRLRVLAGFDSSFPLVSSRQEILAVLNPELSR